jgi:transposase
VQDSQLYATLLGIQAPWRVARVEVRTASSEVEVFIEHDGSPLVCPECGEEASRYDARTRSWRHLDTMQYRTVLTAEVPRSSCSKHGVKQLNVPWAGPGGRFTAMFERLAIDWLHVGSIAAVSKLLGVSWDELDGIMQRAVKRGLARRTRKPPTRIGIDETSFQKRHEYVTVVTDLDAKTVVEVATDRDENSLKAFFESLSATELSAIEVVSMDMWKAYIKTTRQYVPGADEKIAFDRFHVAKHINEGVNDVRKREHRELQRAGDNRLLRTKYLWLSGPERRSKLPPERRAVFSALRNGALKVSRAWAMKETARGLWSYVTRRGAEKGWRKWIRWATRSRLEPMKKVAAMVKSHLWGIVNAIVHKATNAAAESLNAKIQGLKKTACGFRNRERFRNAILFHCGGLDLYPGFHTEP